MQIFHKFDSIILFSLLIGVSILGCHKSYALDKELEIKLVKVIVYNNKPDFTINNVNALNPVIDKYRDIVLRNSPAGTPDFDIRTALAGRFYKWEMYQQARVIFGEKTELQYRGAVNLSTLEIYIEFLADRANGCKHVVSEGAPQIGGLLLSQGALRELGIGENKLAVSELASGAEADFDWELIADNLVFVDRMTCINDAKGNDNEALHDLNKNAVSHFLIGTPGGWDSYLTCLLNRRETLMQSVLFQNLVEIIAADAELYDKEGDGARCATEIKQLKQIALVLGARGNNDEAWINYLIEKITAANNSGGHASATGK